MKTRVMVINDSQEILDLFQSILAAEGYEIRLVSFGDTDMDEIKQALPDLLILDFLIGDERHGWQLVQKLKMHRETATIPIIICSGSVRLLRELEGWLGEKGIGTVLKPFDIDDLLLAVRKMLESSQTPARGRLPRPARRKSTPPAP